MEAAATDVKEETRHSDAGGGVDVDGSANSNDDANNNDEPTETKAPRIAQVQGLPLDWTQLNAAAGSEIVIRYPSDVAEIDITDDELCIVGTAGQKITNIGPDFSATVNPAMRSLILRSHLIRKIEGLQNFTCLELLELYDNQIESLASCLDVSDGRPGSTLRVLDIPYNVIRDMDPVAYCPNLQELCTYIPYL
jgi:hypothetical protein